DLPQADGRLEVHPRKSFGFAMIARAMWAKYRARSALALSLMIAQAFLFNAVFFTYGLVLATFYDVPDRQTGLHLVVLAASNFLGPVLLGTLFDTVGWRIMISLQRCSSHRRRRGLRTGTVLRLNANARLDGNLFLRIGRRQLGLPPRKRDLPLGNASAGHRHLLRGRHGRRRHRCACPFRLFDRKPCAWSACRRIFRRGGLTAGRRRDRGVV